MLDELYKAVGEDNILNELENQGSNGLYIRIPLDRNINIDSDILIINSKDDINAKNEKLFDWFKIRKRYCSYITSNKAIVIGGKYKYPKLITTNQINGIKFNSKTLIDKSEKYGIDTYKAFLEMAEEFCNTCNEVDKFEYYKEAIILINRDYKKLIAGNNIVVNMYLDVDISTYIINYNDYMNSKLLDSKLKDEQGIFSMFATSNANKPYLFMQSNIHNNSTAYQTTIEKAENLRNLNSYLMRKSKDNIKYKNGTIKYECKEGDILQYEYYPTNVYDIFEKDNLYIKDYKIDTAFKFKCQIENLTEKSLNNDIKMFKVIYGKYYENINNINIKQFRNNYERMMKNLYLLAYRDFESEYKIKNIIDFNMHTLDYFFKTNTIKEFEAMKDHIKKKILILRDTKIYIIQSDDEYWYLVGALIHYVTNLSKTNNSTLRLKINYCNINRPQQVLQKLNTDFKRYCYDIDTNSRCLKIYSAILNYSENIKQISKLKFQQGLFDTDNIMFVKSEENKLNDEGEM